MKTLKLIVLSAILIASSACKEIFVTTQVNKDGSFTRIITLTGDSAEILNSATPYPVDPSWVKQFSKDSSDSSKYILTYTKSFKNSDLLNSEIAADTSWMKQIKRKPEVSKQAGFFYSYLVFTETYSAYNPFSNLNYKNYLTDEDLAWLSGDKEAYSPADSVMLKIAEDKQENYLIDALTKEITDGLKTGIERLNNPSLPAGIADLCADSIREEMRKGDFKSDSALLDKLQAWSGNTAFAELKKIDPPVLSAYNQSIAQLNVIFNFEGFKQTVEMPGIITETNSTNLIGNRVSWEVEADSFLLRDKVMMVESRVVNYWAFILTGLVVLCLLVLIVLKGFRK